ncbi:MAG: DUF983 domain-containing protein [Pseudomonadota bacterium]|nr:DUF983 domain-containing protein [Pseudomonadota bacterium]
MTLPDTVWAGLKGRCPRCHQGKILRGLSALVETCPVCHLSLTTDDSGDGPAVFLIFILGTLVVPPALWLALSVDWPLWVHAILWSAVILGLTVGMLRPAKGLTVALGYHFRTRS